MSRPLWISAGGCLLVAVVLTLLGVGDRAGALAELASARAGARPGRDGATADLLVRSSDPRAVARRLAVPEGARHLQPDVRRGAPPGDARGGGWVFLARHRGARRRLGPDAEDATASGRQRSESPGSSSWRRFRPRSSALLGEDAIASNLGEPWQIAIALAVFALVLWYADRSPSAGRWASSA